MAVNLDDPPIYDVLIRPDSLLMSGEWVSWFSSFIQNLSEYLSQNGIFIPRLTTAQRNEIQTPVNGTVIYNTTTNTFQCRENSAWRTITTAP